HFRLPDRPRRRQRPAAQLNVDAVESRQQPALPASRLPGQVAELPDPATASTVLAPASAMRVRPGWTYALMLLLGLVLGCWRAGPPAVATAAGRRVAAAAAAVGATAAARAAAAAGAVASTIRPMP